MAPPPRSSKCSHFCPTLKFFFFFLDQMLLKLKCCFPSSASPPPLCSPEATIFMLVICFQSIFLCFWDVVKISKRDKYRKGRRLLHLVFLLDNAFCNQCTLNHGHLIHHFYSHVIFHGMKISEFIHFSETSWMFLFFFSITASNEAVMNILTSSPCESLPDLCPQEWASFTKHDETAL